MEHKIGENFTVQSKDVKVVEYNGDCKCCCLYDYDCTSIEEPCCKDFRSDGKDVMFIRAEKKQ